MHSQITIENNTLTIHSVEVTDDVAAAYIAQLQPEARADGVVNCLRLGAHALTFAGDRTGAALLADSLKSSTESTRSLLSQVSVTAEQSVAKSSETLEKSVTRLLENLGKELEDKLDPANTASIVGRLRSGLLDDYAKVTAKVRQDLDLANPLSPLSALRSEVDRNIEKRYDSLAKQLGDIQQQLAARAAAAAERGKSTRKGMDFEAATEEFLVAESRPRKDLVRRTGTEFGLDQNMVGDFVIEINPRDCQDVRVVVESKHSRKCTAELLRELDKAMKNRGAAFGISVVTDPSVVQAIIPFGDDKLIVRVPAISDDEWDFTALSVALDCARWKTVMGRMPASSFDIARIKGDVSAAFAIANRFAAAKSKITAGKNQLDGISEYLDEIRRDLTAVLERIQTAVEEAREMSEAA